MSEWISVLDRLPEFTDSTPDVTFSDNVLVACSDGLVIGSLNRWRDEFPNFCQDSGSSLNGVTHWMPLPDPPK